MVLFSEVTWAFTEDLSGTSRIIWRFLGVSGTPSSSARISGMNTARSPGKTIRKMKKSSELIRDSRDLRGESPKGFGKERRKGIRDIRKCWDNYHRFSRCTVVFPDVTSAFTDDSWGTTNSILRSTGSKSW